MGLRALKPRAVPSAPEQAAPERVRGATCNVTLPTGRPAVFTVPADITDIELVGLIEAAIQFTMQLRSQPGSRIVLPA